MPSFDYSGVKLGKKAVKKDIRTLQLARYLTPSLPPPPDSCAWSLMLPDWGMMKNDTIGDCTVVSCAHAVQTWTEVINQRITISDSEVIRYYSLWGGYDPQDPNTDQGIDELTVLTRWRKEGFSGHQLAAFASVKPTDVINVRQAIALFGGIYIGVELPISAQKQEVWDLVQTWDGSPGSWGGHSVWVLAYDKDSLTCITWGQLQKMTWRFWENYVSESYALFSPDFINNQGISPSNFDSTTLKADLNIITS